MFKNLGDKIKEIGNALQDAIKNQNTPLDLSKFNNPIAQRTDWSPLKPGGTNFRTHKFITELGQVQFKASRGGLLFPGVFMAVGLITPVVMMMSGISSGISVDSLPFLIILVPLVFFIAGFLLFRSFTKPIVFSKTLGFFWKGRLKGNENPEQKPLKVFCRLRDIVALQIVSERVRSSSSSSSGRSSSFRSYEINLILQDAGRLNVIDHGNKKKLLEDAKHLASYLGVPVWDGTSF